MSKLYCSIALVFNDAIKVLILFSILGLLSVIVNFENICKLF